MVVVAPAQGYLKMIKYGQHKSELRWDQLTLQSFFAGFWVGLVGHACTTFAGNFFNPDDFYSSAYTKVAYAVMFPCAFIAVVYTGTELFTGNTVTMIMLALNDGKVRLGAMLRVWLVSLVGNCAGAVFVAFLFTYLSGTFDGPSAQREFLLSLVEHKVAYGFSKSLILGIGCNCLVCLATWCCVVTDDGAGKILAIFYTISIFVMGNFEHIVANFYTITAGYMIGFDHYSFGKALAVNWLPVLIGNFLGGTLFTGVMWWYALHPAYGDLAPYTDSELARELSKRHATALAGDPSFARYAMSPGNGGPTPFGATPTVGQDGSGQRWQAANRDKSTSSLFSPNHLQPSKGPFSKPPTDLENTYQAYLASGTSQPSTGTQASSGARGSPPTAA